MRWLAILGALVLAALAYLIYEFQHVSERPAAAPQAISTGPGPARVTAPRAVPPAVAQLPSSRPLPPGPPPPAAAAAPAAQGPAPDRFPHQDDAMSVAKSNTGPIARREAIEWLGLYGSHEILFQLRELAIEDADPEIRRMAREVAEKMESRFTQVPAPEQ